MPNNWGQHRHEEAIAHNNCEGGGFGSTEGERGRMKGEGGGGVIEKDEIGEERRGEGGGMQIQQMAQIIN